MQNYRILWHYLKNKKLKLFTYIFLIIFTYIPSFIAAFLWGIAVEFLLNNNFIAFIIYISCWSGLFILCYSVLQYPRDKIYNELEISFIKEVSIDLYKKIQNLPSIAFEEIGVGEFINRLYTDPDRIMELLEKLIKMICKSFVVILILVVSFKASIILFLEIIIFSITMGFISYKYFPKIKSTQEKIKKESDEYVKVSTENITGIREIKSLGIKKNMLNGITLRVNNLFKHSKEQKDYEITYYNLNNLVYFLLQLIIFLTCGKLYIMKRITFSIFAVVDSYLWRIDEVVESLSDFGVNYNKVKVSLKRIDEILNNKLYNDEKFGDLEIDNIKGNIEFKNVKFKYRNDEEYVLNDLNLKIIPNKLNAMVGRSGNGKSTLFNLLLRYFDATDGNIYIDDIDIKDLKEEFLRRNISIIRQNPFIFNLSVIDNFKLVKNDLTIDEVRRVCKMAYIDDYIMSLPNGYNTIIGEGGVNLSGGQKQRLAIARTLLLNTKIILFDEATSALDNESQKYIKKTIDDLVKDHTIIVVAHRLSTIIDADIINVIDKGKVVGTGNHEYLINNNKIYQKLYNKEQTSIIE